MQLDIVTSNAQRLERRQISGRHRITASSPASPRGSPERSRWLQQLSPRGGPKLPAGGLQVNPACQHCLLMPCVTWTKDCMTRPASLVCSVSQSRRVVRRRQQPGRPAAAAACSACRCCTGKWAYGCRCGRDTGGCGGAWKGGRCLHRRRGMQRPCTQCIPCMPCYQYHSSLTLAF